MTKMLWVCSKCGSSDVEHRVLVNPNDKDKIVCGAEDPSDTHCNACEESGLGTEQVSTLTVDIRMVITKTAGCVSKLNKVLDTGVLQGELHEAGVLIHKVHVENCYETGTR